jgi:hypothetical protein
MASHPSATEPAPTVPWPALSRDYQPSPLWRLCPRAKVTIFDRAEEADREVSVAGLSRDPSYFTVAGVRLDTEMSRLRGLPAFAGGAPRLSRFGCRSPRIPGSAPGTCWRR